MTLFFLSWKYSLHIEIHHGLSGEGIQFHRKLVPRLPNTGGIFRVPVMFSKVESCQFGEERRRGIAVIDLLVSVQIALGVGGGWGQLHRSPVRDYRLSVSSDKWKSSPHSSVLWLGSRNDICRGGILFQRWIVKLERRRWIAVIWLGARDPNYSFLGKRRIGYGNSVKRIEVISRHSWPKFNFLYTTRY